MKTYRGFAFLIIFIITTFSGFSQQNLNFLSTYYIDQLYCTQRDSVYSGSSLLPITESRYNLNYIIRDSSDQYYEFTEYLFKKHLIELAGKDYYVTISPIADLSVGKDNYDTLRPKLFQNTRGILIEGDLLKNFSFCTSIFENQARFASYENNYYSSIGELYPKSNGTYLTQNAVIPGGARTKPFKTNAYDYAYSCGNISYQPRKWVSIVAGNTGHFLGDGYRSLFLSDNSVPSPFIQGNIQLSNKWEYTYLRMRLMNLIRRPVSTTVESYYETKGYSLNYLTYKFTNTFSVGILESAIWYQGDSTTSIKSPFGYYNPLPFGSNFLTKADRINFINGINISWIASSKHRIYGQFALNNFNSKQIASQIGWRGYNLFGLKQFMLQIEHNYISENMYEGSTSRMSYSSYNMPLAHVKGNAFNELILRSNYEWKRIYTDVKFIMYILQNYSSLALLPISRAIPLENGTIYHHQIEIGYRMNRKMNLTVFGSWILRSSNLSKLEANNLLYFGIRTGINNHYKDF